jgi:putative transposase
MERIRLPRGAPHGLSLRHDNGLVFGSRQYRTTASEYRLKQEFITPYTPEDNGLCERFIRSFKEECAWQHQFASIDQARRTIARFIQWYNADRPPQAMDYQTPNEHHATFLSRPAA